MVFCNKSCRYRLERNYNVTILILIDGFLQYSKESLSGIFHLVTILILIDGFLQSQKFNGFFECIIGHNPYFNRWFSAITFFVNTLLVPFKVTILILIDGFLQFIESFVYIFV